MFRLLRPLVLNDPPPDEPLPFRAPHARAEELQRQVLAALAATTAPDGKIDYASLRASAAWAETLEAARALQGVQLAELTCGRPGWRSGSTSITRWCGTRSWPSVSDAA
jgi:hypothetical protein